MGQNDGKLPRTVSKLVVINLQLSSGKFRCGMVLRKGMPISQVFRNVCFITGGPIKQFSELLIHTIKLLAVSPEGVAGRRGMEREGEKSSIHSHIRII